MQKTVKNNTLDAGTVADIIEINAIRRLILEFIHVLCDIRNEMRKLIPIFLFVTIFAGCQEKIDKEIIFFENIDFSSGNYKIYVFALKGKWIEDFENFVIDDIETLNEIKKKWVFKNKVPPTGCGYGYKLNLVDQEQIIKSIRINIDCEYMTGWVKFPKEYLTEFKNSFKRLDNDQINEFKEKYN